MTEYSVAEARNNLPKLIDRMLAGEDVTITRRGEPVARLAPHRGKPRVLDLEDIRRRRILPEAGPTNVVQVMEELRAEDDAC